MVHNVMQITIFRTRMYNLTVYCNRVEQKKTAAVNGVADVYYSFLYFPSLYFIR